MSRLGVDLSIASRSLWQHRRRTIFLGSAIAAVTALLILLGGLARGIEETMFTAATTIVTGHVNVGGFYKVSAGQVGPLVTEPGRIMEALQRNVPELDHVSMRGRGWGKLVSDSGSIQAGIDGVDIEHEPKLAEVLRIAAGNIQDLRQPRTVLIFEKQAQKLKVGVGDALTFSAATGRGVNNTVDVRVVAVARDMGLMSMFGVFVPNETLRTLYQLNENATGAIHLFVKDRHLPNVAKIAARLRTDLEKAGFRVMRNDPRAFWFKFDSVRREEWTGQKLDVTTWEDEISFMKWTLTAVGTLTTILISILLAIVILGIMNTMWIAIRERTREIGTLRAIGMQRGGVLWMFLLESLMLGVLGTAVGALIAVGVAAGLNALSIALPTSVQLFLMSDHLFVAIDAGAVLRRMAVIAVVTALAALYPALRAARLKPITAMQHFG